MGRSEEHTSELQSPDQHSFPTRRSSDLDDAPSSQVMKSTPPFWKAEEARMLGTTLPNQPSPVAIEQSCMSLHMLGVIQAKFGTVPAERSVLNCVDGKIGRAHV